MGSLLNPYLSFKDTAREAMEFYQSVFGGELTINTFGEYGDPDSPMAEQGHAQHADDRRRLHPDGLRHPREMAFTPGSQITISLSGDANDADTVRAQWEQLSEGATVTVPLAQQVWGDEFGQITDRFGIAWMVNIGGGAA